jgi:hypothetical protein
MTVLYYECTLTYFVMHSKKILYGVLDMVLIFKLAWPAPKRTVLKHL